MSKTDENGTVEDLKELARKIYDDMANGNIPSLEVPVRTKSNIIFDPMYRVWKLGDSKSSRNAKTLDGAYGLLRALYVMDFIKEMIDTKKSSTLREMYYISEGWNDAKFSTQDESNRVAEDLEVLTSRMRESFKLRPEEDGASVVGNITVEEVTRKGDIRRINCRDDVGDAGYTIPYRVEKDNITFKDFGDSKFIMAIETGGMFARLIENGFDEKANAILVHLKGQPSRSTRRFLKRMHQEGDLPVYIFTDGDPWSYRIFASVAYGAIKTAHISEYLATPDAQFVGITPSDIINYDLPTDKLSDKDVDALKSILSDPRFDDEFWRQEVELQLEIKKKSEQQALAKYGLDFVTDTYLPEKMAEFGLDIY